MKNIFLKFEDDNGKMLPEGHRIFRRYGPDGFAVKVQLQPENDAAWQFLQDVEQIMRWLGDRPIGDIDKGLRLVSDMESYFTTWRHGPKLVEAEKLEEMRADRDYQQSAKEALQRDNDAANRGETT